MSLAPWTAPSLESVVRDRAFATDPKEVKGKKEQAEILTWKPHAILSDHAKLTKRDFTIMC